MKAERKMLWCMAAILVVMNLVVWSVVVTSFVHIYTASQPLTINPFEGGGLPYPSTAKV